ncbi:MAG TPA: DUF503 domain-containing protein [Thermoanaerobaculia bacterium]
MVVGVATFELHIPSARSLKDKRRVVKALIERLHHRYRLSIVESRYHDLHQRAEIGLAAVAVSAGELERLLEEVHNILDQVPEAYLTRWEPQILEEATSG